MKDLWDVYIWPINNAGQIRIVAKAVDFNKAQEFYNHYFDTNLYDAYMVPTGTDQFGMLFA